MASQTFEIEASIPIVFHDLGSGDNNITYKATLAVIYKLLGNGLDQVDYI